MTDTRRAVWPTAEEARDAALECVDGPVVWPLSCLPAAIERAQWAAVREMLEAIWSLFESDFESCDDLTCGHSICDIERGLLTALAEAERRLSARDTLATEGR